MMAMKAYLLTLQRFIFNRWKLLLIIGFILYLWYEMKNYDEILEDRTQTLRHFDPYNYASNEESQFIRNNFYHPKCMNPWIYHPSKFEKIYQYIHHKFHDYEGKVFLHQKHHKQSPTTPLEDSPLQKPTDYYTCTKDSTQIPRMIAPNRERFFGHFPHFSEMYLRFVSLLLWQKVVYNLPNVSCITQFQVHHSVERFWNVIKSSNGWIHHILQHIDTTSQYATITNDLGKSFFDFHRHETIVLPNSESHFIHPADAMMLTTSLLKQDPCTLAGTAAHLSKKKLNVVLISRKDTRRILNLANLTNSLSNYMKEPITAPKHYYPADVMIRYTSPNHHNQHNINLQHWEKKLSSLPEINNITVTYFEKKTFLTQVQEMNDADIVISIHGAQLTNVIFMKPCSVVIEIMPWLYDVPSAFDQFTRSSDIIHYTWQEEPYHTFGYVNDGTSTIPSKPLNDKDTGSPHSKICRDYREKYELMYASHKYNASDLANHCYQDGGGTCRSCARNIEGLIITEEKLSNYLTLARMARQECILEHPFYN